MTENTLYFSINNTFLKKMAVILQMKILSCVYMYAINKVSKSLLCDTIRELQWKMGNVYKFH